MSKVARRNAGLFSHLDFPKRHILGEFDGVLARLRGVLACPRQHSGFRIISQNVFHRGHGDGQVADLRWRAEECGDGAPTKGAGSATIQSVGTGKMSRVSNEIGGGLRFGVLGNGKAGPFGLSWKSLGVKTPLAIAFGSGQGYVVSRAITEIPVKAATQNGDLDHNLCGSQQTGLAVFKKESAIAEAAKRPALVRPRRRREGVHIMKSWTNLPKIFSLRALTPVVMILASSTAIFASGAHKPVGFVSPEQAAQAVRACQGRSCRRLARLIRVNFGLSWDKSASQCTVSPSRAPLEPGSEEALLEIECNDDFAIVLLKRRAKGRWVYQNSRSFPGGNTYGNLKVSLANISSAKTKDIVIERLVTDHGTGFLKEYFLVLKVMEGRLRTVLDTSEKYVRAGWPGVQDIVEKNVFKVEPPSHGQPGDITEDETLTFGGKRSVHLSGQYFEWDSDAKAFSPGGWEAIKVGSPR